MIREALDYALARQDVPPRIMEAAMDCVLAGAATSAQIAGLAVALRMKGETVDELAAAARAMRRCAATVNLGLAGPLLDTCGTGGDGAGTFNVSTLSAIVVAACGVRVAKHGNRAVSSRAGSADVLEALGVAIDAPHERVAACIRDVGIGFLFAQAHHAALRHAALARRELGVRTFFNLLGPLTNPAGATHQLLGVYDGTRVEQMASVLALLGVEAAWVVHGAGGLDEVSPCGPTLVAGLAHGRVSRFELSPDDFGVRPVEREELAGGDAEANAAIARGVLQGATGAARIAVIVNAAAALCVAGASAGPREGAVRAGGAIDSGAARALLDKWIAHSKSA